MKISHTKDFFVKNIKSFVAKFTVAVLVLPTFAASLSTYTVNAQNVYNLQQENRYATTVNLNLRLGPSISYERLALIPAGTIIELTGNFTYDFSQVLFAGMIGYVASEFIQPFNPIGQLNAYTFDGNFSEAIVQDGGLELLEWTYVRGNVFPQGSVLQIYDVWSSMVYYVTNFSNGNHADVVPMTYTDTEIFRSTFSHRNTWDPRPVIVTANGRSVPAAINGMPHGGANHRDNGMIGHVCLHFFGSRTHNGNRSYEAEMQHAVMQAFDSR